jgi:hypothetical protein
MFVMNDSEVLLTWVSGDGEGKCMFAAWHTCGPFCIIMMESTGF